MCSSHTTYRLEGCWIEAENWIRNVKEMKSHLQRDDTTNFQQEQAASRFTLISCFTCAYILHTMSVASDMMLIWILGEDQLSWRQVLCPMSIFHRQTFELNYVRSFVCGIIFSLQYCSIYKQGFFLCTHVML